MGGFHPAPIRPLSAAECWEHLATFPVGRLIVVMDGQPDVFPVNFVIDGEGLVVQTDVGMKYFAAEQNSPAAFEVDRWDTVTGITVIAHGRLRVLTDPAEAAHAASLDLRPWLDTDKSHYIKLDVAEITGRHFTLNEDARIAQLAD